MSRKPKKRRKSSRIYLSDLVRGLMEYGHAKGTKSFPAFFSPLWHRWLYEMKQKFPKEFGRLFFDADSFPRCREFEDVAFGLTLICNERRWDLRTSLREGTIRLKDSSHFSEPENFEAVVESGFRIASKIEGFLEYR